MKKDVIKYENLIDHIVEELKSTTGEDYSFRCVTKSDCDIYVFSDGSFSDQPCSTDYFVIAKKDISNQILLDALDLIHRYDRIIGDLKGDDTKTILKRVDLRENLDSTIHEMVGNLVHCYTGHFSTRGYSYRGGKNSYIGIDSADYYFNYINQKLLDETIASVKTAQKDSIIRKLTRRYR